MAMEAILMSLVVADMMYKGVIQKKQTRMKDRPGEEREEGWNLGIQGFIHADTNRTTFWVLLAGRGKREAGDISAPGRDSRNGLAWRGETTFSSQVSG